MTIDYSKGKIFRIYNRYDKKFTRVLNSQFVYEKIDKTVQELPDVLEKFKYKRLLELRPWFEIQEENAKNWLSTTTVGCNNLKQYMKGFHIQLIENYACLNAHELRQECEAVRDNFRYEYAKTYNLWRESHYSKPIENVS
jgi:hypothetical protein